MNLHVLKDDFTQLNKWLQEHHISHTVEFSKPISLPKIEEAERILGVSFPPSYQNFVTQYGVFTIPGNLTGRGYRNDTVLLKPEEIVETTLRYRNELAASFDEDSKEILNDGLIFCADPLDEYFHLFVISSADQGGEMKTRSYDYQDPGNNDPWYEGDGTFASVVKQIMDDIKMNALDKDED